MDPLLPKNSFHHLANLRNHNCMLLFTCNFSLIIVLLFENPKIYITQNSHFILLLRTLFRISIIIFISRIIRLQTPAPCGIDIFISKLATNDLYTCSHQAIFWRRYRGAKRCRSLSFYLFIFVLLILF